MVKSKFYFTEAFAKLLKNRALAYARNLFLKFPTTFLFSGTTQ